MPLLKDITTTSVSNAHKSIKPEKLIHGISRPGVFLIQVLFTAILVLLLPVDFYRRLKPICLPRYTEIKYFYKDARMASFGYTGGNAEEQGGDDGWPTKLREVTATIWPRSFCKRVLKEGHNVFWRHENVLGNIFADDDLLPENRVG